MRFVWAGQKFWMELNSHKKRMFFYFHRFYEFAVGTCAAYYQSVLRHYLAVIVIKFVSVTVSLGNFFFAVNGTQNRVGFNLARICAKSHRAAFILF